MIIFCPKCKFEQPKVEFCAKCGINIVNYVPSPKTIKERLFKNAYFYLFLILIVVMGTTHFVRSNWYGNNFVSERFSFEPANGHRIKALNNDDLNPRGIASEKDFEQEETLSNNFESDETTLTNTHPIPNVQIFISQIPVRSLQRVLNQQLDPIELNYPFIHRVEAHIDADYLKTIPNNNLIFSSSFNTNTFEDVFDIHQAVFDPLLQTEIGFLFEMNIEAFLRDSVRLSIQIQRLLYKEENPNELENIAKSQNIELKNQETLIISGLLPHFLASERQIDLFRYGYLQLMNSPEHQSSSSTFIILISYKY